MVRELPTPHTGRPSASAIRSGPGGGGARLPMREVTAPAALSHAEVEGDRSENIRVTVKRIDQKAKRGQPMEHQLDEIRQRLERAERELRVLRSRSRRLGWLAG